MLPSSARPSAILTGSGGVGQRVSIERPVSQRHEQIQLPISVCLLVSQYLGQSPRASCPPPWTGERSCPAPPARSSAAARWPPQRLPLPTPAPKGRCELHRRDLLTHAEGMMLAVPPTEALAATFAVQLREDALALRDRLALPLHVACLSGVRRRSHPCRLSRPHRASAEARVFQAAAPWQ